MFFDLNSLLLMIPAILISLYAQIKVKSTFNKYLKVRNYRGMTGAEVARRILANNGLNEVKVEMVGGVLSDHYDPRGKVVRLSPEVYNGDSISSLGVAAHETGHAIQDSVGYAPLAIRSSLVPVASFGSSVSWILILIGFFLGSLGGIFIKIGIILFSFAVLFQIVTLPVEFNASKRALAVLTEGGYIDNDELRLTKKVLNAAAFTYVAAALVAILELVRLVLMSQSED